MADQTPMLSPDRAISIIELLARHSFGLPLSEIADQLAIPRSATHRLLADLKEEGYVRQDYDGAAYRLTAKLVALGYSFLTTAGVSNQLQPIIDRLAEQTGELVVLAVVERGKLLRLIKAQGARGGLLYNPDEGPEVYLAATSNGHAYLSTLMEDEAIQLVAKQGFQSEGVGKNAPKTFRQLFEHVDQARETGVARIFDVWVDGTSAMAAPVFRSGTKTAIGTISVAGPTIRMNNQRMDQFVDLLKAACRDVSETGSSLPIFEQA
ncbi:IclR family transcriptional regulator [Neorhizobium sp. IRAMC:178]|uniref:IclR family transcriptional regulator n=1 Tax=Neorhizobium tunisiense TaxID=3144793 RepID=UPI0031F6CB2D